MTNDQKQTPSADSTKTPAPPVPSPPAEPAAAPVDPKPGPAPQKPADDLAEPDTFPREVVVNLRREAAGYRDRAKKADEYAGRLHAALVTASGRLADPTDLPYDEAHLADPDALTAAIDDLLTRKPHLASRRPFGDVGQGITGDPLDGTMSLAGLIRAGAN